MSAYEFCPSPPRYVPAPSCAKCGAATMLTRITPFSPGYNLQSFECMRCGNCNDVKVADKRTGGAENRPQFVGRYSSEKP